MTNQTTGQALKRFFEEKELEDRTFAVSHKGSMHMVESDFLKDLIINHTPAHEQESIRSTITIIDFRNGDINDFLEHLAIAYIRQNF